MKAYCAVTAERIWISTATVESDGVKHAVEVLSEALKFVISWITLTPISIIVSGRLLAQLLRLSGRRRQLFQVKIPGIICIKAQDDEVILGFALFIVTLFSVALIGGERAYRLFRADFGLELGQFNSICVLSAFLAVVLAVLLLLLTRALGRLRKSTDSTVKERDRLLEELSKGSK